MTMIPEIHNGQAISIRQSNALITAQYKMSLTEMRVFLLWLAQVKPDDTEIKTYNIRIKHLKDLAGGKSEGIYSKLDELTEHMMNRRLRIYNEETQGFEKIALVSYAKYNAKKGILKIGPDPRIKPHILALKGNFTLIDLYVLLSLRGIHAIRIYKLLKSAQWRTKSLTVEVEELKAMLGVTDAYSRYNDFERYVVTPAVKEINEKTDIKTDTKRIKQGRRIHSLTFSITKNHQLKLPFPDEAFKAIEGGKEEKDSLHQELVDIGLSAKQADSYLSTHDREYLAELFTLTKKGFNEGRIKNPAAYLIKLISTGAHIIPKPVLKKATSKKKPSSRDQEIIAKLRSQFTALVEQKQEELLTKATGEDWEKFAALYKEITPVAQKIFKDGQLQRESTETISWFKYYLYPNSDENFIIWAKERGHTLRKSSQSESGFEIKTS